MLLLSDCEIKACPKGRVKRNVVFNMDLTLSLAKGNYSVMSP